MNFFNRAVLSVSRRKIKTILFMLIVMTIFCFEVAIVTCKNANIKVQKGAVDIIERSLRLELNDTDYHQRLEKVPVMRLPNGATLSQTPNNQFESILMEDIEVIAGLPGIDSYNITTATFAANPVNFRRIEDENADQYSDQRGITLRGNLDMQKDKDIISGTLQLKEGRWANIDDKNVCVISEELAQKNNLKIDDKISFNDYRDKAGSKIYEAQIIGIYMNSKLINQAMAGDTYRGENLILVDLRFPEKVTGCEGDPLYQNATFFVEANANYGRVKNLIKEANINWKRYDLLDDSGNAEVLCENLGSISKICQIMFWFCIVSGTVILFLNFVFWIKQRIREIGIFISLGKSKLEIVGQFLTEALIIFLMAITLSIFLVPFIGKKMTNYIVLEQEKLEKENNQIVEQQIEGPDIHNEEIISEVEVTIEKSSIVKMSLVTMSMIVIAVFSAGSPVIKKSPMIILSER